MQYFLIQAPQQLIALPGDGPYLAHEYGASCPQDVENRPRLFINAMYPFRVNEDCLYLNIFSPEARTSYRNFDYLLDHKTLENRL